jgi:predicted RNase H-like nuclease (RuvC/YqgF family)
VLLLENKQRLQKLIKDQQKQIEELEGVVTRLEMRVNINEGVNREIREELRDIRRAATRIFWIVTFTLFFVIIIMGS